MGTKNVLKHTQTNVIEETTRRKMGYIYSFERDGIYVMHVKHDIKCIYA